jgi:hypothetical protein
MTEEITEMASEPKTYERGSNVATIATAVIAIVALLFSGYTYLETTRIQQKVAAFTFWQSYLQLAAQKPKYANGNFVSGNTDDKEAYEWFASNALGAAETVYLLQKDDPGWQNTIKTLIRTHRNFINSPGFVRGHYDPAFRGLIDQALKEKEQ